MQSTVWRVCRRFGSSQQLSYFSGKNHAHLVYHTISQQLRETASKHPDRLAAYSEHEKMRLTYSELLDRTEKMAAGLLSLGLEPQARAKLRAVAEASRLRTLVLCSELVRVHRLLTAAGVLAVPYKGPALAACLYGDVAVRQMLDIDLIVRPSDAVKARRILVENACHPLKPLPAWRVAAHVWYHCDFVFRGTKGVCVDLTWRNAPAYWQLPQMPAAAWNRR